MQFVKPGGQVVDGAGNLTGQNATMRSHWIVGALALGAMLFLAGCDPNKPIAEQSPDFASMTPNQLCVSGMSLAAATAAIAAAAETKEVDLLDTSVAIGNAICATIAAMGSPSTLRDVMDLEARSRRLNARLGGSAAELFCSRAWRRRAWWWPAVLLIDAWARLRWGEAWGHCARMALRERRRRAEDGAAKLRWWEGS